MQFSYYVINYFVLSDYQSGADYSLPFKQHRRELNYDFAGRSFFLPPDPFLQDPIFHV